MFHTEEEINPAVNHARKLFGMVGRYAEWKSDKRYWNVSIATREYGKLWYGDIVHTENLMADLNALSKVLNQKVYLLDDQYSFQNALLVSN
jgi:hypothetical protein